MLAYMIDNCGNVIATCENRKLAEEQLARDITHQVIVGVRPGEIDYSTCAIVERCAGRDGTCKNNAQFDGLCFFCKTTER